MLSTTYVYFPCCFGKIDHNGCTCRPASEKSSSLEKLPRFHGITKVQSRYCPLRVNFLCLNADFITQLSILWRPGSPVITSWTRFLDSNSLLDSREPSPPKQPCICSYLLFSDEIAAPFQVEGFWRWIALFHARTFLSKVLALLGHMSPSLEMKSGDFDFSRRHLGIFLQAIIVISTMADSSCNISASGYCGRSKTRRRIREQIFDAECQYSTWKAIKTTNAFSFIASLLSGPGYALAYDPIANRTTLSLPGFETASEPWRRESYTYRQSGHRYGLPSHISKVSAGSFIFFLLVNLEGSDLALQLVCCQLLEMILFGASSRGVSMPLCWMIKGLAIRILFAATTAWASEVSPHHLRGVIQSAIILFVSFMQAIGFMVVKCSCRTPPLALSRRCLQSNEID